MEIRNKGRSLDVSTQLSSLTFSSPYTLFLPIKLVFQSCALSLPVGVKEEVVAFIAQVLVILFPGDI